MTDRTKPVSARLPVETVEEIEKRLKKEGLTLRELLESYAEGDVYTKNEGKPKGAGIKPQEKPEDIENIRQMGSFFGFDVEGMIHLLSEGLEGGYITVKDGKLAGEIDLDLEDFYDVCHDKGIEPQKAIDKMVSMLWK